MAIRYVYSGATGSNNGTSKTNAWTSIQSALDVAGGDVVLVHKTHSQAVSSGVLVFGNGTEANPVRIVVIDFSDDSPATGAVIDRQASVAVGGNLIVDGITFQLGVLNCTFVGSSVYRNCTFVRSGTGTGTTTFGGGSTQRNIAENCTFDNSSASQIPACVAVSTGGELIVRGGQFIASSDGGQQAFIRCSSNSSLLVEGVDFQGEATYVVNITDAFAPVHSAVLRNCRLEVLPSTLVNGLTIPGQVLLERCEAGTISQPALGLTYYATKYGSIGSSLSRYRVGGADDGEQSNEHSWEMASSAGTTDGGFALESPPIARWVDAGNHTLTIRLASDLTLQDDEFWIEVLSPSEAGSPTSQARLQSTRCQPMATPANLTADGSSTWNGSNVSVAQEISVSIAPAIAGMVTVRCCLARPSTTVYVDPLIEVS